MSTCGRRVVGLLLLFSTVVFVSSEGFALTVKTKADARYWETVTDRSNPLSWPWETNADSAELTFSNRLSQTSFTVSVMRDPDNPRGAFLPTGIKDGTLFTVTLRQLSGGEEISRETAELAFVSGVAGHALNVRTKSTQGWWTVGSPRLSGFDAAWWNVNGPSGYEILWARPSGWHRVTREFAGAGVVDTADLYFSSSGFRLWLR